MKHPLLAFSLALSLSFTARAQSANPAIWCPAGATWVYGYGLFYESGTLTVRYARDTVVAGQPAQLLTRQLFTGASTGPIIVPPSAHSLPSVVMRTVADRVEVRTRDQFYTLYDFAAVPGSSWLTPRVVPQGPCPSELVAVNVDSVGTQRIAGRSLRWFRAHLTTPTGAAVLGQWLGRIYEQLGNVAQYMQPQSPTCAGTDPGYMGFFTKFQATGWPTIGYNGATGVLLPTAQARAEAGGFRAYPNPSAGFLTLMLPTPPSPEATLHLLDLTGRVLRQLPMPASRQLDLRGLPAGTYSLLLMEPGQPPLAQRLVVQ